MANVIVKKVIPDQDVTAVMLITMVTLIVKASEILKCKTTQRTMLATPQTGLSQSEEISSDLCCFHGGGISHNEDAFFSKVYCCLILNYPTPIQIWIWKLVVRALTLNT